MAAKVAKEEETTTTTETTAKTSRALRDKVQALSMEDRIELARKVRTAVREIPDDAILANEIALQLDKLA